MGHAEGAGPNEEDNEMVQVDVPAAFAAGGLLADAARKQLRYGGAEYHYRAMLKNNIFQIFFFSWIPVYFLMNYFGWETTHMWWHAPEVSAYPYYLPVFLLIFFASANLGFLLGRALVRGGRDVTNRIIYLGITAFNGIWIFGQWGRTFKLGSWEQWHNDQAPWFWEDSTFLTMFIISMVVWVAGLVWFAVSLMREGRHLEIPVAARAAAQGQ